MARLVGSFLILALITVSVVGYIAFTIAKNTLVQSVFDRLEAVATLKEDNLNRWIDEQRQDMVFIAWSPEVRTQTAKLFSYDKSDPEFQAAYNRLSEYLAFVTTNTSSDLQEISILAERNGWVVLSTEKRNEGEGRSNEPYFTQGRSGTYVQHFAISRRTGKPTMIIATPVFNIDGKRIAVLAAQFDLARIDRLILERTGLGRSGETYLVNPAHIFVSEARFAEEAFAGGVHSAGIEAALQGQDSRGLYLNYVQIPVIGVYRWIDEREVALLVEISQAEAFAPARQLAWTIFTVGIISAGLLALIIFLIARQIARPILAITDTAAQVAAGDLTAKVPVLTEDEVGVLASTFNKMTGQLYVLYTKLEDLVAARTSELQTANKHLQTLTTRLQNELALARRIQQGLLPPPKPEWLNLDVFCYSDPAREVGGDFYTYHHLDRGYFCLTVGDVSGKGLSAALLMATSLAHFDSSLAYGLPPDELLAHLDRALVRYTQTTHQNCALCYVEIDGLTLRVANAGCIPPYIRRVKGGAEFVEVGGLPLGCGLGAEFGYQSIVTQLDPGDLVVLTSDGVVEAQRSGGSLFGFERLEQAIASGPTTSPQAMLDHLKNEVRLFTGDSEPHDDLTIVVLQTDSNHNQT